jgi:hypothetical protein
MKAESSVRLIIDFINFIFNDLERLKDSIDNKGKPITIHSINGKQPVTNRSKNGKIISG